MVSNAVDKSNATKTVMYPDSTTSNMLVAVLKSAVSVEWNGRCAN